MIDRKLSLSKARSVSSNPPERKHSANKSHPTRRRISVALVLFLASVLLANKSVNGQAPESTQPVTISFDTLPTGTLVTNQYQQVRFSATGFSAGSGGSQGFDVYAESNNGLGGSPYNALRSDYNPTRPNPFYCRGFGDVYLDFPIPVSNLSFKMLNVVDNYYCDFYFCGYSQRLHCYIDAYVNRYYYGTFYVYVPAQPRSASTPFPVNLLSGVQNITGIKIYYVNNSNQSSSCYPTLFDDFTFTPDFDVKITNARVNGYLNETTQKALAGADVALNAAIVPSGRTGGTYSWTFTGPYTLVGGATNSSSVTIRSTDVGTIRANVTYTLNGSTASTWVDINTVLPTLTSYTAVQGRDIVVHPPSCGFADTFVRYRLGCTSATEKGIELTAQIQAPTTFISDPAQSGTKYVQAVSGFRKRLRAGNLQCSTRRTTEADVGSGWQLDTTDPYNGGPTDPIPRFSQGNVLTMATVDYPSNVLTFIHPELEFVDAFYVDDRFEMYVLYFTGSNAGAPIYQRVLGKLTWNWGGQVVYKDQSGANHYIEFSNAPPGNRVGTAASSTVAYTGNVEQNNYTQCVNGPPAATSLIDGSRRFVRQHYLDFLNRSPDQGGWDYWTSQITFCAFNFDCIRSRRLAVSLAFFYAAEFMTQDPIMAHPPGSPGFDPATYNPRFVYYCYTNYLDREPEPGGSSFWTNVLNQTGDYFGVVDAFITSNEYRNGRFPAPP